MDPYGTPTLMATLLIKFKIFRDTIKCIFSDCVCNNLKTKLNHKTPKTLTVFCILILIYRTLSNCNTFSANNTSDVQLRNIQSVQITDKNIKIKKTKCILQLTPLIDLALIIICKTIIQIPPNLKSLFSNHADLLTAKLPTIDGIEHSQN